MARSPLKTKMLYHRRYTELVSEGTKRGLSPAQAASSALEKLTTEWRSEHGEAAPLPSWPPFGATA